MCVTITAIMKKLGSFWPLKIWILTMFLIDTAKADANPQQLDLQRYPPNFAMEPCAMQDKCCGMANMNCCIKGKGKEKCYTTWERHCDEPEDENYCAPFAHKTCIRTKIKVCRVESQLIYRDYPVTYCTPIPLRKCFNYTKKVCIPQEETVVRTIHWENDKLVPMNETTHRHCFKVNAVNCTTSYEMKNVTERVQKSKMVPDSNRRCAFETVMTPENTVKVPVTKIINKRACYKIPFMECKPLCANSPCFPGTSPCSKESYPFQVCPMSFNGQPVSNTSIPQHCQNVKQPMCNFESSSRGNFNGFQHIPNSPCMAQDEYKNCCHQTLREVCQNVPTRVTYMVTQKIPGNPQLQQVCKDFKFNRTEYYWVNQMKQVNQSSNNCSPEEKEECVDIKLPVYDVQSEKKSQSVNVRLPRCEHREVEATYCHEFPVGDIQCRNATARKAFRLHKIKCDQEGMRPKCVTVPIIRCDLKQKPRNCYMKPRTVCRNDQKCISGGLCSACEDFRMGSGFGQCERSSCGNFISKESWVNGTNFYDDQIYPELGGAYSYGGLYNDSTLYNEGEEWSYPIYEDAYGGFSGGSSRSFESSDGSGYYRASSGTGTYGSSRGSGSYEFTGGSGYYGPSGASRTYGSSGGSYGPSGGSGYYGPLGESYRSSSGSGSYVPSGGSRTYGSSGGSGTYGSGTHGSSGYYRASGSFKPSEEYDYFDAFEGEDLFVPSDESTSFGGPESYDPTNNENTGNESGKFSNFYSSAKENDHDRME